IGQRPINNIVDITNFILHETGQPLHAFDAAAIAQQQIIVQNVSANTPFITLDEKERKLLETDLLICDGDGKPMCVAGVFGGSVSGVKQTTTHIFLESACFNSVHIRRTSLAHGLRTDAATRFEKGVDISNCVNVLKRAALLIKEIAGGEISSDIIDVYPTTKPKTEVTVKYQYIKKLSGKSYHPDAVKKILTALGFEVLKEGIDELKVAVPYNKPDISLPADLVEEIVRIDGLDNIAIPTSITMSPSIDSLGIKDVLKDKIANYLVGLGCNEIFTNSITNSNYFDEATLNQTVKMVNNLSVELNVLRPSILETGLECIAYNNNRKNTNLQLFEFGKTYHTTAIGNYNEVEHLAVYITGNNQNDSWQEKAKPFDFYYAKGVLLAILKLAGITNLQTHLQENNSLLITSNQKTLGTLIEVSGSKLKSFDIKQPVYFLDIDFQGLVQLVSAQKIVYKEVPKFPAVQRDLALILSKETTFDAIEKVVLKLGLKKLQNIRLFDVFENEKLGQNKKSMAISFTFLDEEKTLVDKEVDNMMQQLIQAFEKQLLAEIRR
ncbi:MAG: phenylalanine--tRNA ligase subunit beta, partial [Chitinophagaceae bacterium]